MGILNVTPDSFSDGGKFVSAENVVQHVNQMIASGADIIDVGGESSRPFATPVTLEEELNRVIPAIQRIRREHSIPISVDTTKAEVARQAIAAGADIINDISALRFDPAMAAVVKKYSTPIIIMHMQGVPTDMQVAPAYDDIIAETIDFFRERLSWLINKGIPKDSVIIDPGIGFGKTIEHNLTIINHLEQYHTLGRPIMVGHSRKSFIAKVLGDDTVDRDIATAAISSLLAYKHTAIIRVHDVEKNYQSIKLAEAILAA